LEIDGFETDAYGLLDYDDLAALLAGLPGAVSAANLHGMLAAHLCVAGQNPDVAGLLSECLLALGEGVSPDASDRREIAVILAQTISGLDDPELGFQLLLPLDDSSLVQRTLELANWCQGFLFAFAVAEKKGDKSLSQNPDIAEMLEDFVAISAADTALVDETQLEPQVSPAESEDHTEESEENEEDLMHLAEYVRVAVMNTYAECHAHLQAGDSADTITVH